VTRTGLSQLEIDLLFAVKDSDEGLRYRRHAKRLSTHLKDGLSDLAAEERLAGAWGSNHQPDAATAQPLERCLLGVVMLQIRLAR
jgi:hypothetical protein